MKALYSHTIQLIEPTKLLERNICDTMTVTNTLQRAFDGEPSSKVSPEVDIKSGLNVRLNEQTEVVLLYSPITVPENAGQVFQVPIYCVKGTAGTFLTPYYFSAIIKITEPNGTVSYYPESGSYDGRDEFNPSNFPSIQYTANQIGTYTIQIFMGYPEVGVSESTASVTVTYALEVREAIKRAASTPWTITDVVNRILSAGETRRVSLAEGGTDIDKQKYIFDAEQASDYKSKPAPEFFFTRGTLRGALDTVGAFIHGIPRLQGNYQTIKYLELGKENPFTGKLPAPIYVDEQIAGDEYANVLDSPAQNLLNTTDRASGAVVEPSSDGWRALNSTGGEWLIAANTMTIITDTPIYQVEKLELKWGTGGSTLDATAYLYEAAEYDVLSSYTGEAYPYSKGWALRYAQGGQEITGLNFVLDSALCGADENYAIVNILQALGGSVNNGADFANNLFYRVTYIPIAELRVTQKKPYLTHNGAGSLIYNQGGNTIESEYYGQKLKGVIARIGNKVNRRTYIIRRLKNLPQIGQTFYPDGVPERITNVDREFNTAYIKATVTSVPNFNRIAEYTGVNSNYRLYDISEKQSVDRFVHYEETCVISNSAVADFGNPMITWSGMSSGYATMFSNLPAEADNTLKQTAIEIQSKAGRTIEDAASAANNDTITKSCASFGFGNSLVFYSNMTDNYGAGKQSTSYEVKGKTRRASRQVQYGDGLGNISTMSVRFGAFTSNSPDGSSPFLYPEGTTTKVGTPVFDTGNYPFFISKDSREAIHFTYQLHHQADNLDIVIGNGLCKYNTLVSAKQKMMRFYWLDYTIDKISPAITSYKSTGQFPNIYPVDTSLGESERRFYINTGALPNTTGATMYAWVLCVVEQDAPGLPRDIVIGQNFPDGIAPGAFAKDIYFNFVDNAVLETLGMAE